jgi:methylated-DNA-[protein]-cysteine S-methyltransferase
MKLWFTELESPIGLIRIVVGPRGLCALDFADRWETKLGRLQRRFGTFELARTADADGLVARLRAYFDGALRSLESVVVDPGGTAFQRRVWSELRSIPAGSTISYGSLATRIGKASGARPVGAANGQNPIAIVVPCHRVIGADGSLTGYAGGLARKRWLLAHEAALSPAQQLELGPAAADSRRAS